METMAFLLEKKVGGRVYVYEVKSIWDKKRKMSRQERKYVGRRDSKSNEIIKSREPQKVKLIFDYGDIFLVDKVIDSEMVPFWQTVCMK